MQTELQRLHADLKVINHSMAELEAEPSSNQSHHINEIIESLKRLDSVWEHLVAEEQQRGINLLVAEVRVNKTEVKIQFRDEGIDQIAAELKPIGKE